MKECAGEYWSLVLLSQTSGPPRDGWEHVSFGFLMNIYPTCNFSSNSGRKALEMEMFWRWEKQSKFWDLWKVLKRDLKKCACPQKLTLKFSTSSFRYHNVLVFFIFLICFCLTVITVERHSCFWRSNYLHSRYAEAPLLFIYIYICYVLVFLCQCVAQNRSMHTARK